MSQSRDAFHGIFTRTADRLSRHPQPPSFLPDPRRGRDLRIATGRDRWRDLPVVHASRAGGIRLIRRGSSARVCVPALLPNDLDLWRISQSIEASLAQFLHLQAAV
jgi:hypothetical protein